MPDGCSTFRATLDDVLDGVGGEEASDRVHQHAASCPACRALLQQALRHHLLLLEPAAAAAEQARDRPRAWRRGILIAGLASAACIAAAVLIRPSPTPAGQPRPEPSAQHWPWLTLETTPGTSHQAGIDGDGVHRVRLESGRLRLASTGRPADLRLELLLGTARAELLGTRVEAAWETTTGTGLVRVMHGAVAASDGGGSQRLEAGQEALLAGERFLPALPTIPGTAWGDPISDRQALPIVRFADAIGILDPSMQRLAAAGLPGGSLVRTAGGNPDAPRPRAADRQAHAALDLALAPGSRWDLQLLCTTTEDQQFGLELAASGASLDSRSDMQRWHASTTGAMFWMPASRGDAVVLVATAPAQRLEFHGYRPGTGLIAVVLRPLPVQVGGDQPQARPPPRR